MAKKEPKSSSKIKKDAKDRSKTKNPFIRLGRYFKGAWFELRQVRWPDRKSTWGMTGALLIFTGFFVVLILLLDSGFQFMFRQMLG